MRSSGRLGDVHVVAEFLPVAGLLPEGPIQHVRGVDLVITPGPLPPAHIADERAEQGPALRMPEHGARRLFLEMKQIHLAPKAAMIALLRLLELMQIGLEILFARPGGAVDPLKHRAVRIAAPIGARDLEQLEAFADLAGGRHVRAAAEIEPVALRVKLEVLPFRNRVDQFELEILALLPEQRLGIVTRDDLA